MKLRAADKRARNSCTKRVGIVRLRGGFISESVEPYEAIPVLAMCDYLQGWGTLVEFLAD